MATPSSVQRLDGRDRHQVFHGVRESIIQHDQGDSAHPACASYLASKVSTQPRWSATSRQRGTPTAADAYRTRIRSRDGATSLYGQLLGARHTPFPGLMATVVCRPWEQRVASRSPAPFGRAAPSAPQRGLCRRRAAVAEYRDRRLACAGLDAAASVVAVHLSDRSVIDEQVAAG